MGKFLPGLFIGIAIGFLIAPKRGSELRLELADRYKQLQNKLPSAATPSSATSPTMNANTDQITLPADTRKSARPTNSPIDMSDTSSSTSITAPAETPEDAKPDANRPYSKPTTNNPTPSRSNTSYQASGKQSTQNRSQTNANQKRRHS